VKENNTQRSFSALTIKFERNYRTNG